MPYTEAQKRAEQKYRANNKELIKYRNYRSKARNFVMKLATKEDLEELKNIIEEKLK